MPGHAAPSLDTLPIRPSFPSAVNVLAVMLVLAAPGESIVAGEVLRWQPLEGGRFAVLPVPSTGRTGFTTLPALATGIHFTNVLSLERGLTNQIFMSGSGVALGDVDNDGLVDIYLCALDSPNRLYRNLGGWKFADVTGTNLMCREGASTGAALTDIEGDGDLDLFVSGIGRGVRLFQNDGAGRFTETTDPAGLRSSAASMSLAIGDTDGDGDLDLYVANYRSSTFQDEPAVRFRIATTNGVRRITMINGRAPTAEELNRYAIAPIGNTILENGEADMLYRNEGNGRFSAVSWTNGAFLDENGRPLTAPQYDWGYTAMFRDMNGDGSPDLYICNDNESPDRAWLNDGKGRFRAMSYGALRQTSLSSMGVDFADLNRDGFDEFIVVDMLSRDHDVRQRQLMDRRTLPPPGVIEDRPAYQRNTLFLNRGDNTYAEIAQMAGVDATDWSWLPIFLDVDLDGYEDLLVTTGLERSLRDVDSRRVLELEKAQQRLTTRQFQDLRKIMPPLDVPNRSYRNRGDLTFEETSSSWGFDSRLNSQGMALGDLDNDGDLDVIINVLNGPALVLRNESAAPRLAVRLRGGAANVHGIGARIRVTGGPVLQSQEMMAGGRYLSSDEAIRTFAAGHATNHLTIEVTWRDGRQSLVSHASANRIYEVDETHSRLAQRSSSAPKVTPWFSDVSHRLNHQHAETAFNDFERQSLLPRRFSQLGPGVCWSDLNQDGREDLIIGSGKGRQLGIYLNDSHGGFTRVGSDRTPGPLPDDSGAIVARSESNAVSVAVPLANYERTPAEASSILQFQMELGVRATRPTLPGTLGSFGPASMADVDADGFLDLFVGGRLVPGRYPEAARSELYRGGPDGFGPARRRTIPDETVHLVSGTAFSDLDADGYPDLLIACEWGPVRFFRNRRGEFEAWDPTVRIRGNPTRVEKLSALTGWWNSVTGGDFDSDGRMDVVAGNWGRNSKYQQYLHHPLAIHFGDLRGDGGFDVIEAHWESKFAQYVPWRHRDMLSMVMPSVAERFPSANDYSQAGLNQVLGEVGTRLKQRTAVTLDSFLFLNRGDYFEGVPLPVEAQLSPAFGLCVGDFNGDGNEDLFVAQNFFAVDSETSRYDAGRGLLLSGDGRGNLTPLAATVSGIDIGGEQRGAAAADFDSDGRLDLLVTQNGSATRLFRNETASSGLRVRVEGGPGNRNGIGAVLRLKDARTGRHGAAKEIRAGAGYWSQDSSVQIISTAGMLQPVLETRWPGGKVSTNAIPVGAKEIVVEAR